METTETKQDTHSGFTIIAANTEFTNTYQQWKNGQALPSHALSSDFIPFYYFHSKNIIIFV